MMSAAQGQLQDLHTVMTANVRWSSGTRSCSARSQLSRGRIGIYFSKTPVKQMPYESGMDPVGDARQPFNIRFYLVAILFLVFDVELLYLYPWAVSAYVGDAGIPIELRGSVFGVMLVFMSTLVIAYVYAWRKGVFRWR